MRTIDDRLRAAARELHTAPGPLPDVWRRAARRRHRRTAAASVVVVAAVLGVVALRLGTSPADRSPAVAAPTDVTALPSDPTTPATPASEMSAGHAPETSAAAPVNQVPIAVADLAASVAGTRLSINVLANDMDPDGAQRELVVSAVAAPAHGTAVLTENIIVYRPADGFAGIDTFGYTVADPSGATSNGLVTIEVLAPNEP